MVKKFHRIFNKSTTKVLLLQWSFLIVLQLKIFIKVLKMFCNYNEVF